MSVVRTEVVVPDAEAAQTVARLARERTDVVVERRLLDAADGAVRFEAAVGSFRSYHRSVRVERSPERGDGTATVVQEVRFELGLGIWTVLFLLPMRRALARPPGATPWWAPPEVLDRHGTSSLIALAQLSIIAGYLGTLITQTLTFAADEFDAGERAQSDLFAAVRIGVLIAMVVAAWADRHGRRRALLWCTTLAILVTASGAIAPDMVALGASQLVARGLATAIGLLIVVVVAEEMPAGSRAYGVSLLTMTAALGAGLVLWVLPIVDIGERAWRLLYVLPLLFLPLVAGTARVLPESRRFERRHGDAAFAGHGRRLALLAGTALALAMFSSPASQLQNEYLRDRFSFEAGHITAFTLLTVTPGAIGIVIGGRLADVHGRRVLGAIGIAGGTAFTALQFVSPVVSLVWITSALGSIVGSLAVPAMAVYGPELFPTALRTKANTAITTLGVLGSVLGLLIAGRLAERWSLGPGVAALAVGPAIVVLLLIPRYPETAHRELEELNPEDAIPEADESSPGLETTP